MLNKTEVHQYFFEVDLERTTGRRGLLKARTNDHPIEVVTPPEFAGGEPGIWSPEELFLGALCSCLMTTYLAIAEKKKLHVAGFSCSAIGQVQLVEGHLEFTVINLFPKIKVGHENDLAAGNEVLMKAYKHCIIANSIKAHLVHHGEVLTADEHINGL